MSEEFTKIITDFTNDLIISYPEYQEHFNVINFDEYFNYCKNIYPKNFFNILYENNELFDSEDSKYLLPNIDFHKIMNDESLSETSKKTIWKYLQLVLFCVCNNVEDKKDFGDANYLFGAINEDDLHTKIQQTMDEMKNIFLGSDVSDSSLNFFEEAFGDISNVEEMFNSLNEDSSGNNPKEHLFENMRDAEEMKDHLSGIMDGKIGKLAKEIAEEASKELGLDENEMDTDKQQDFMKNMFKNPAKILNIVKNIGNKLEEKFKSGEMKESELLEEAQEIMSKMKDMPGLKDMMKNMGMDAGGKFDFKGMAGKMKQSMSAAKQKERMQEKLRRKKEAQERLRERKAEDLGNITQVNEDVFVWNDSNSNPSTSLKKTSTKPKKSNKKNKGKKKKN